MRSSLATWRLVALCTGNFEIVFETIFKTRLNLTFSSISGAEQILKEYPCMAAVDRACKHIERHRARAIWLDYTDGKPERTIVLIGKGLTYDTGGADIKAGGSMAGMHRDKVSKKFQFKKR